VATHDLTGLEEAFRRLALDLRRIGLRFALVGGLAVSARAEPRLTRDADVAVSVADDKHAETVVRKMLQLGYVPDVVLEQYVAGRLATVRFLHHDRMEYVVDLLFASSGIEPEIVDLADEIEVLPGLVVPVARVGHLIAMKLLARDDRYRPADADDLRSLAAVARDEDWVMASDAVRMITSRGFHRDRDLYAALAELRA
jgi:hypothetical protein